MDIIPRYQDALYGYIQEGEMILRRKLGGYYSLFSFSSILLVLLMIASLPAIPTELYSSSSNSDSSSSSYPPAPTSQPTAFETNTAITPTISPTAFSSNSSDFIMAVNSTLSPELGDQTSYGGETKDDVSSWLLFAALSTMFLYSMMIIVRMFYLLRLRNQVLAGSRSPQIRQLLTTLGMRGSNDATRNTLRSRLQLALINRDFNGDDYDMLRQLDEMEVGTELVMGRNRGVDPTDINRLPLHTVTASELNASVRKQCSICLAPYEISESVRTLSCMHQYHSHCIDHWLESNSTCPICKFDIVLEQPNFS